LQVSTPKAGPLTGQKAWSLSRSTAVDICSVFRKSEAPAVVILTNDWKDEPIIPVADDFESSLKKLARDEED
jgi:hypothetical protein